MKTITKEDKSLPTSILQFILRQRSLGTKIITPRKQLPAGSQKLTPHNYAQKRCDVSERHVSLSTEGRMENGIWVYDMRPKQPARSNTLKRKRKRIYYFAGGAWQMPPSPEHWKLCAEVCNSLSTAEEECIVTMVSYPLAPNSPAAESFPALVELYIALMTPGSTSSDSIEKDTTPTKKASQEIITFAGDSAGGNIVLSLVLHMLSQPQYAPLRIPDSLLVISPTADLTPQNPSPSASEEPALHTASKYDPILSIPFTNSAAATWAGKWDASDPRLTPLNADMAVLAKKGVRLYGVTGSYDVLSPPTIRFKDECERLGVEGEWLDWRGQMHCFPLAWVYGMRESKEAKEWMLDVLRR
ncbi:hypothetical protein AAFC00_003327 [Neodothiora populina]|uniref:Alpha/beta hydrolase fold-3 domain-containing protein n=1 Tax=Neodothiora populina TaxID=2781224 RepID=A0ABR3PA37_9PEZI